MSYSQSPSWWITRGVIDTNQIPGDYAPVVAGQLKWMASMAKEELDANLFGGSGTGVAAVVSAFTNAYNLSPVLIGQLKHVAFPFHNRLTNAGYSSSYPWTATIADDEDFAPALIGQLKYAFNFDVTEDTDENGLPDWWESLYGVSSAEGDADSDGLSNYGEYFYGTNPNNADTDSDGMPDLWEVTYGLNPINPSDASDDLDGDGLNNVSEYQRGTYVNNPDSDNDLISDGPEDPDGFGLVWAGPDLNPTIPSPLKFGIHNVFSGLTNLYKVHLGQDNYKRPIVAILTPGTSNVQKIHVMKRFSIPEGGGADWSDSDGLWEMYGRGISSIESPSFSQSVTNFSFSVKPSGDPALVWSLSNQLFYSEWDGTNWVGLGGSLTNGIAIDNVTQAVSAISLAVFTNGAYAGKPGIAYAFTLNYNTNVIKYKFWNGSAWAGLHGSGGNGGVVKEYNVVPTLDLSLAYQTGNVPCISYSKFNLQYPYSTYFIRTYLGNSSQWLALSQVTNGVRYVIPQLRSTINPVNNTITILYRSIYSGSYYDGLWLQQYVPSWQEYAGGDDGVDDSDSGRGLKRGIDTVATVHYLNVWNRDGYHGVGAIWVEEGTNVLARRWNIGGFWEAIGSSTTAQGIHNATTMVVNVNATDCGNNPFVVYFESNQTYKVRVRQHLVDSDGNGLNSLEESYFGITPGTYDSNNDGIPDIISSRLGFYQFDLDSDNDGVSNADEQLLGTNPLLADTDGDGVNDDVDAYPLDPLLSSWPAADPGDHTPPTISITLPNTATLVP